MEQFLLCHLDQWSTVVDRGISPLPVLQDVPGVKRLDERSANMFNQNEICRHVSRPFG